MSNFISIDPKKESTSKVYSTLLSAVAPRPIALVSSIDTDGNSNLSPFSQFGIFSANPPVVAFSTSKRVRDKTNKHTLSNAESTGEVVINVVNHAIVEQMSLSSAEYGEGINEFIKSGLTEVPSDFVKPSRVLESPVSLECKVLDIINFGSEGGAGSMVICEIIKIHISKEVLDENDSIDSNKIDLVARMGGQLYCRASGDAVFEITRPGRKLGIGVDQIPIDIRNSTILTGNDLGQLGNIDVLPSELDVNDHKLFELSDTFVTYEDDASTLEIELHKIAKGQIKHNKIELAWKTLLAFND